MISDNCQICAARASAPRRFKLTVGVEELKLSHEAQVDTIFTENRPVCHMVDLSTQFRAAQFLRSMYKNGIWRSIQQMWIYVCLGPPDFLLVDQGTGFISKEMRSNCSTENIFLCEAPVGTPGSIGTVKRYQAPLRTSLHKIIFEIPRSTTHHE